jgi:hypothetical protein
MKSEEQWKDHYGFIIITSWWCEYERLCPPPNWGWKWEPLQSPPDMYPEVTRESHSFFGFRGKIQKATFFKF